MLYFTYQTTCLTVYTDLSGRDLLELYKVTVMILMIQPVPTSVNLFQNPEGNDLDQLHLVMHAKQK